MIELTRLNKKKFILNCELIETIESTPDTVITLRNGKLLIVTEPPEEIVRMIIDYKKSLLGDPLGGIEIRENKDGDSLKGDSKR